MKNYLYKNNNNIYIYKLMSTDNFESKINKYKKKIINLTGGFELDEKIWIPAYNRGQHNCGIWINAIENKLLKCVDRISNIHPIYIEFNKKYNIFPKLYDIHHLDNKIYIEYEKLDGDITSIFFELIPKRVLKSMNLSEDISNKLMKLHQWKTPNTMSNNSPISSYINSLIIYIYNSNKLEEFKNRKDTKEFDGNTVDDWPTYDNIKQTINNINILKNFDMNGITIELYDTFINNIFNEIDKVYYQIIKSICRLYIETYEKGYILHDFKFDNYGYKIIDSSDKQRYGEQLFENKFNIYALDEDSNFSIKTEYDSYKHLQYYIDNMFESFSVNGQYDMKTYNNSCNNVNATFYEHILNKDLYEIVFKKYSYNANERMLRLNKEKINIDEYRD